MALLDSEVQRIKYELGFPVMSIGAEPRIDHVALFDQVIKPYIEAGAATTAATAVTAATTPTPVALTLTSATGFTVGAVVIVDVDSRQERATIQTLSGTSMTVQLSNAHSGTYPVTVEGGESMVRDLLGRLRSIDDSIAEARSSAGLKSVGRGAVEWYEAGSVLTSLKRIQMDHRDELASMLGVPNLWRRRSGGSRSALY